ncbi:Nramp family divalent metal transporter [Alicyclobacillus ferrooxydans]|uniref:Manganese transporter n=1 Tax=Alicyclobacillus ferrooxydans TaxID=471514 RepID=A0A0P9CIM9_9BACL|nr:Nramp family divalent metal transporter [Alicyclobacillus ferrooxydans]KPV45505.1 manganese transporter [Alicyclobacillus ferrooxydans]
MVKGNVCFKESAVLDAAHQGDIKGALGTVRVADFAKRATWGTRIRTLLAIMGPGLIVMVGDNDAGGVSTYAQAGQNYGTSLLWVLLLLIPVLIVCQEMAVRLGLVTGVGHARLIFERFGKFWGMFSVGDLFVLNFLTIVTEFIGISMAMSYFGVSAYISVPAFALILILVTLTGSFRKWETFMFVCVAANFVAIPLAFLSHPHIGPIVHDTFIPSVQGGLNSNAMLLIIGMVGTTVAPWQLFFQQSNVIDKRLTPRWMRYEQMDTTIGAFVVVIGAAALIIATAFAFHGTKVEGQFVDAATVAHQLRHAIGRVSGDLFAIALLNASIIGAGAVTLSTSYAFGDVFNMKHSLHRKWSDAKGFYSIYAAIVLVAAGIVLIPHAPLGLMTILVQVLAGVLLPSATAFLLLLCNDKAILGPWVNKAWQNVLGSVIVGVLTMLSLILAATTMFPQWNVNLIAEVLAGVLVVGLVAVGVFQVRKRGTKKEIVQEELDRWTWRMPPLKNLPKAMPSRASAIGMLTLRGYLVVAVLLLVVKAVELTLGH